ncbi:MAG: hypothetical protein GY782_01290 [Gammaproteobacteria bacterium]|nr:hypothetical protein [Gammaproteobacteria bacterium]
MSRTCINNDKARQSYDYEKQVWIVDGRYVRCGHPDSMDCGCYGRTHEGEEAVITEHCK